MEKKLSYSLVYTPDTATSELTNPVCSDKRIHIRFRDFNKPQMISGFERKLTYLMTALMNYS